MNLRRPPVTILTASAGLGVYVPALLNQRALRDAGHVVDVEVIEGWFTASHVERHLAHKTAFGNDFKLALIGHRMPKDVQPGLDVSRIDTLLDTWVGEERRSFIVWSGFWFSVLQRYIDRMPHLPVTVDLGRIDAVVSASFRIQPELTGVQCRDIWLWNWAERRLGWRVPVAASPPVTFLERDRRLVAHGGGWALGNFCDVLPELSAAGYALDVLAPTAADWAGRRPTDRRFAHDPDWQPWHRDDAGQLSFPPLGEVGPDNRVLYLPNEILPPAHVLIREAAAIVSKPGGGTLIDSLAAATPVVLLDPFGDAEARSGDLWEYLGFGIRFDRWRETGFDQGVLAALHRNLLAAQEAGPIYPPTFQHFSA